MAESRQISTKVKHIDGTPKADDAVCRAGRSGKGRFIISVSLSDKLESTDGAVDVRVKRTINANEWSTICLPFAMMQK